MKHSILPCACPAIAGLLALLAAADADAACLRTPGAVKPWTGQYVYQFDPSTLVAASSVAKGCGAPVPDLANWVDGNNHKYTIKELYLEGVADWLENEDFPVNLTGQQFTTQAKRVVVTAFCDQANHYTVENVPGYGVVPHLNIRPMGHSRVEFDRTVRHETGHSLGFGHMHQRWDAAEHVTVHPANIPPGDLGEYTPATFAQCNSINLMLPYDYYSVMHYRPNYHAGTCDTTHSSGCELSPGSPAINAPDYNPNYAVDFGKIQNALQISYLDRVALQLYYPPFEPDTPVFFNPEARLWSFLARNDGMLASETVAAQLNAYSTKLDLYYRTPYGDGDPAARPLVAPWMNGDDHDFLGEVYHGSALRDPFYYHGDANGDVDADTDLLRELFVYNSAKFVTIDTDDGVLAVAYVPSVDYVLYDADDDGHPDTLGPASLGGVMTPHASNEPFSGDFFGEGQRRLAVREQASGLVYIDSDGDLEFDTWTEPFMIGTTLVPFAGDWVGRGHDMLGFYAPTTRMVYLDRDDTFKPNLDTTWSPDVAFRFGPTPQPGDALLRPAAGRFDLDTVRTDIPWGFNYSGPDPWDLPQCQLMSDNAMYCPEVWQWCLDLHAASDGCFAVVCEDSFTATPMTYVWPAGCSYDDFGNGFELTCDLGNDCMP